MDHAVPQGMDRVWVRGLDPYLVFLLVPKNVCVCACVCVCVCICICICICIYVCMSMYICMSMYACVELSVLMVVVGRPHLHDCSNRPSIHPSTHPSIHSSIHSLLGTHLQKGLISDDFLTSSRAEMLQDKRIAGVMLGLWVLRIVFPTHQCQH